MFHLVFVATKPVHSSVATEDSNQYQVATPKNTDVATPEDTEVATPEDTEVATQEDTEVATLNQDTVSTGLDSVR